jgi:predicted ArsR family transcriptional regulator
MQEPPGDDALVHRALSNRVRTRILTTLRDSDEPLRVRTVASQLQLHINTVRGHLGVLEEAGLVASKAEQPRGPGRPQTIYWATDQAQRLPDRNGYRFLAEILAGYIGASSRNGAKAGEKAGTAWGRHLVDRPVPFQALSAEQGIDKLVHLLDEMGFSPTLDTDAEDGPRIELRRCPFLAVVKEHQDVVCSVHLGLMRGALETLEVPVRVDDLIPFAEPDVCVSHLTVAE